MSKRNSIFTFYYPSLFFTFSLRQCNWGQLELYCERNESESEMRKRDRKLIYYDDDQWTIVVQNNITN